jgi:hypothetical protein
MTLYRVEKEIFTSEKDFIQFISDSPNYSHYSIKYAKTKFKVRDYGIIYELSTNKKRAKYGEYSDPEIRKCKQKKLIGQTIKPLKKRIRCYKYEYLKQLKSGKPISRPIFKAFRMYGPDSFTWKILNEYKNITINELEKKEAFYILNNKTLFDDGLNFRLEKKFLK